MPAHHFVPLIQVKVVRRQFKLHADPHITLIYKVERFTKEDSFALIPRMLSSISMLVLALSLTHLENREPPVYLCLLLNSLHEGIMHTPLIN